MRVVALLAGPSQPAWNNQFRISIPNYTDKRKARPSCEGRAAFYDLRRNQPRVRERIMKLS
jgi:hypothetical protein